jgi:hypothetical protein
MTQYSFVYLRMARANRLDFDSRQGQGLFLWPDYDQTDSAIHSVSYPLGTGGLFPCGKVA